MLSRALVLMLALLVIGGATSNAMCVVRCVAPDAPLPCHHHQPAKQKPCDARTQITPVMPAVAESPLEFTALIQALHQSAETADPVASPAPHPNPPPILRI